MFFADVFVPRPPFDEILGFKDWVVEGNPHRWQTLPD